MWCICIWCRWCVSSLNAWRYRETHQLHFKIVDKWWTELFPVGERRVSIHIRHQEIPCILVRTSLWTIDRSQIPPCLTEQTSFNFTASMGTNLTLVFVSIWLWVHTEILENHRTCKCWCTQPTSSVSSPVMITYQHIKMWTKRDPKLADGQIVAAWIFSHMSGEKTSYRC